MAVGKVGEFDIKSDVWTLYVERVEQYFIANDVKEEKKVPILVTLMGKNTYELAVTLCHPDKPSKKTFEELTEVIRKHVNPKPSVLAERYKFRQRKQKSDETISDFIQELKKLSRFCDFSTQLDENMRDQLVCGLKSDLIRQRLFAEDNVTFTNALKLAISLEAAERDAGIVEGKTEICHAVRTSQRSHSSGGGCSAVADTTQSGSLGRPNSKRKQHASPAGLRSGELVQPSGWCQACGYNHNLENCKFKYYTCKICLTKGHLKKMCPQNKNKAIREHKKNNFMHIAEEECEESLEVDNSNLILSNYNVEDVDRPIQVDIKLEGKTICMEIDTGSAISLISSEYLRVHFPNLQLMPSRVKLRYYTGEIVNTRGIVRPIVEYNGNKRRLDLYIIDNGKTCLLGRNWLREMKIRVPVPVYDVNCENNKFNENEFISRYPKVFAEGLGRFTGGTVGLRLRADAAPIYVRARPLPFALREKVEAQIEKYVQDGVLQPVDTSDWASPIVPIVKKDGSIRICADYKITVNKYLEIDRFPVPRIEELLAKLGGGQHFSKIDLAQAYSQFELKEEDRKYTVINTHRGLFQYTRLVFGLSSSPGIFQRKIEEILRGIPNIAVFLDDILITGKSDEEHRYALKTVFDRLEYCGLRVKRDKCAFFQDSVNYLGFKLTKNGVTGCEDKLQAIEQAPAPKNVSELRSFIGMVMYYGKFVKNLSTVLDPLYALLKKKVTFEWTENCDRAFNKIKLIMMSTDVLAHYNPDAQLILTCDASSVGVGAVLSQLTEVGERPLGYSSRTLSCTERGYSQIDKEALGIIFGVKKYHQYLYGRRFTLRTDHKPLVSIFGSKKGIPVMAASRLQRWAVLLGGYDYSIEYIPSKSNSADALSRLPCRVVPRPEPNQYTYLHYVEDSMPILCKDIKLYTGKDIVLNKIVMFVQRGWPPHCQEAELKPYFCRRNELYSELGCLMWGHRVVVPAKLRDGVLKELHESHMGIVKTKSLARSYVWWPKIDEDIERLCRECVVCAGEATMPPQSPPTPWKYNTKPWTRLHIDFLGPFRGSSYLVIVDSTSKWVEVFKMTRTNASSVVRKLRELFARFGLPEQVVSDNGPPFNSEEFGLFMKSNGIKQAFSPIYFAQSNGAAENAVKLCKQTLKKAIREGKDEELALQQFLLSYRNTEVSSTGSSPAMILQRRRLRTKLDLLTPDVDKRVREAQESQVRSSGGVESNFQVGDKVWARHYQGKDRWMPGVVKDKLGSRLFVVARDDGQVIKRHIDQMRSRVNPHVLSESIRSGELDNDPTEIIDPRISAGSDELNIDECIPQCKSSTGGTQDAPVPMPLTSAVTQEVAAGTLAPTVPPIVRRSTRNRKPPDRYGF